MESGKASVWIRADQLHAALGLPSDVAIAMMQTDIDPYGLRLLLVGPSLPEVPPGAEAPRASVGVTVVEQVTRTVSVDLPTKEPF